MQPSMTKSFLPTATPTGAKKSGLDLSPCRASGWKPRSEYPLGSTAMRVLSTAGLALGIAAGCGSEPLDGTSPGSGGGAGAAGQSANAGANEGGAPDAGDPRTACVEAGVSFCNAVYACLSADDLFALELPESVTGCVENMSRANTCDAALADDFCNGTDSYDADAALRCAQESKAASCAEIQSGSEFAPSCNLVCVDR
jgi:hypothetical protein